MPPKRKSGEADGAVDDVQPRRSTRQRTSTAQAREAAAAASASATPKKAGKPAAEKKAAPKAKRKGEQDNKIEGDADRQLAPPSGDKASGKTNGAKAVKTQSKSAAAGTEPKEVKDPGRQYWLMKAEPESRVENGVDVRFSIDDLAAKSEPEPWDGMFSHSHSPALVHIKVHIRTDRRFVTQVSETLLVWTSLPNLWQSEDRLELIANKRLIHTARNNLRAMKKGDLAFFYHSNCKEPGIAGTMEIVQEHSPDRA